MADPVVVVGGGIGGLTTALALTRRDIDCVVFEQAPELHEIGTGVSLWPPALAVLDCLGLGEAVNALGGTFEVGGIRTHRGDWLMSYSSAELAAMLGGAVLGVHRGELQSMLRAALPDAVVRTGSRCIGVDASRPDRAIARFADGTEVMGRAVIGADGNKSTVRASLFGDSPLHDCGYMGWRGTVNVPAGAAWHREGGETWGPDARFGILPISDGRIAWYGTVRTFDDGGSKAEALRRFAGYHDPVPAMVAATAEDLIFRDRIYDRRPLRRWSVGNVTLLGDAAHPMTPELGQGACQAIIDADALAEALAREPDVPTALREYERRRKIRTGFITGVARMSALVGNVEGRRAQAIRQAVARRLPPKLALRQLRAVAGV